MKTIFALPVLVALVSTQTVMAQPVNTPVCNKPNDQTETFIAISPINQNYLFGVWTDYRSGGQSEGYAFSLDGGVTWKDTIFVTPGTSGGGDPTCAFDRRGNAFYLHDGLSTPSVDSAGKFPKIPSKIPHPKLTIC